jgi:tetratricopeptide (TPR) repeat protein
MAKRLYNIKIKADSDVTFQKIARLNNRDNGLYIQQGRALFSTRSKFKGSRLEALSPVARAEVIGTQFSVDVDPLSGGGTWISVFRGKVSAEGLNPPSSKQAVNKVIVGSGQRVYVGPGNIPDTPRPLQKRELEDAYEIYRMADTSAVVLMISAGPGRVEELLAPCMLYIHDVKPRRFSREFDKAISDITDAINKNDINLHASALKRLKALCDSHRYQEDKDKLYLFLGAYAYFIKDYRQALEAFDLCLKSNPNSPLASLALCAEAVAYERGLKDKMQASAIYNRIIQSYPDTPESEYSKTALKKE